MRHHTPTANAPPIGRPQGIAPTRHPLEKGAGMTVRIYLPLLAADGNGIVPPAFPAPLAPSGSTG